MVDGKLVTASNNNALDTVANAAVMAGLNFFTTLAAISSQSAWTLTETNVVAAGIAAGLAFFTSLAIQRGLKKEATPE